MTDTEFNRIVSLVSETLVNAGSTFREDKKEAYRQAIKKEDNENARWVMETILENADAAEKNKSPLCDDTGIPHLVLEIGEDAAVSGRMLDAIKEGVAQGLRKLPGRPMGIMGDDSHRIDQSGGLDPDSAGVAPAPVLLPGPVRRQALFLRPGGGRLCLCLRAEGFVPLPGSRPPGG